MDNKGETLMSDGIRLQIQTLDNEDAESVKTTEQSTESRTHDRPINLYNAGYDQVVISGSNGSQPAANQADIECAGATGDGLEIRPSHLPTNSSTSAYDQRTLPPTYNLQHDPFSSWNVQPATEPTETVSDLRFCVGMMIIFNPAFGILALIKAVKAQQEYQKGNVTRAQELNSYAMGLALGGFAITVFIGAAVVAQQILLDQPR